MLLRQTEMFTLRDLQEAAGIDTNWFTEQSTKSLAGRCLLDTIEYLGANPKFPGRFRQVANAHAIRLVATCLTSLPAILPQGFFVRMRNRLTRVCNQLRECRGRVVPFYGDDFWDWASILDCFWTVHRLMQDGPISRSTLDLEMEGFKTTVESKLEAGLRAPGPYEWYGPATAVAAHRVLSRWSGLDGGKAQTDLLNALQAQALEPIVAHNKYRGEKVPEEHVVWHLSQVVASFPDESESQWAQVRKLLPKIERFTDPAQRVYSWARVIQAARVKGDKPIVSQTTQLLYEHENQGRPLGEGLIGENVKGSVNVLEVLWPSLLPEETDQIARMLKALVDVHTKANTVTVLVAVDREANAICNAFEDRGARIEVVDGETFDIVHENYHVVVRQGKALIGSTGSVLKALGTDKPKWVFMSGIAGSLGTEKPAKNGSGQTFVGPDVGDVVLAVSLAPYRVRDKVRGGGVENARVPLGGTTWSIIPVDPGLFALAHAAAEKLVLKGELDVRVWEGQIVTGTGIKDDAVEKTAILAEFPGGLAAEEESFIVALHCLANGTPCAIVRGISDLAEGDKIEQQKGGGKAEEEAQVTASSNAAKVVAATVELLSSRW